MNDIFLLNKERVLFECIHLAKSKIATALRLDEKDVEVEPIQDQDGKLQLQFKLDFGETNRYSKDRINAIIRPIYADIVNTVSERLDGIKQKFKPSTALD